MQIPRAACPHAAIEIRAQPILPGQHRQTRDQQYAGGNRRAFKVRDLVAALRKALGGHVVAREAAYPATYKVNQYDRIPTAA